MGVKRPGVRVRETYDRSAVSHADKLSLRVSEEILQGMPRSRTSVSYAVAGESTGAAAGMQVKPCYRTEKGAQRCAMCGAKIRQMHMPIGRIGHFCEQCCPVCVPAER